MTRSQKKGTFALHLEYFSMSQNGTSGHFHFQTTRHVRAGGETDESKGKGEGKHTVYDSSSSLHLAQPFLTRRSCKSNLICSEHSPPDLRQPLSTVLDTCRYPLASSRRTLFWMKVYISVKSGHEEGGICKQMGHLSVFSGPLYHYEDALARRRDEDPRRQ